MALAAVVRWRLYLYCVIANYTRVEYRPVGNILFKLANTLTLLLYFTFTGPGGAATGNVATVCSIYLSTASSKEPVCLAYVNSDGILRAHDYIPTQVSVSEE